MGSSQAAYRYANALLILAREKKLGEVIGSDLERLGLLFAPNDHWIKMMTTSTMPLSKKVEMVEEVLGQLKLHDYTKNFIKILVEKNRLPLYQEILGAYRQELLRIRGEVEAHVTVARKAVWENLKDEIAEIIKELTGAEAQLKFSVDETLVGGLTIRVGDKLYDGSVRGELSRLREAIVNQAGEI